MLLTRFACVVLVLVALGTAQAGEPPTLENADLKAWEGGAPVAWKLSEGAKFREGPASKVLPGGEGGVRLEGDAATGPWQTLSQQAKIPADATCRLSFEARLLGGKREEGQGDNAYVGLRLVGGASADAAKATRLVVDSVLRDVWTPGEVVFRAEDSEVHVQVFLNRTGALEVRTLALEVLAPEQSFDVLVQNMGRYYSFFQAKKFDWAKHAATFRERAVGAADEDAFIKLALELLEPLHDPHVWVRDASGTTEPTYRVRPTINFDGRVTIKLLTEPQRFPKVGVVGRIEGLGYVAIGSLPADEAGFAPLLAAVEGLLTGPGLILDLRPNGGGNELRAQALVGRLLDQPRVYAKRRVRAGPRSEDFGPWRESTVKPVGEKPFLGPIVVLIGPGCVSSGEGMAKMLRARPNTVFLGQPTRGASANPAPVPLPNGVDVWFSRWEDALPDGTLTEGTGLPPDTLIEHEGEGDPTLTAGVERLKALIAAKR